MRIILLGNAGAGKSTMARRLIGTKNIPRLSLDEIAWEKAAERKSLEESLRLIRDFLSSNTEWSLTAAIAIWLKQHFRTAQSLDL